MAHRPMSDTALVHVRHERGRLPIADVELNGLDAAREPRPVQTPASQPAPS
jgi:hypothetical protein